VVEDKVVVQEKDCATEADGFDYTVKNPNHLLRIMNKIMPIFLNVPDEEMYNEVLKILLETTESRHGIFAYIDENGSMVAPSMTKDIWDQCQIPDKTYIFPRDTWGGIWGRSLNEKRALFSNGGHDVPSGHIQIRRSICVPLIHLGEVVGLFAVANRTYDYSEEDVEYVKAIAGFVAPVLDARLTRDRSERERRRAEEALRLANKKLNLMGSLTRHDALNQLNVVLGYAEMMREPGSRDKAEMYLDRIIKSGNAIRSQLEFTKVYQSIGSTQPDWQNVRRVFDLAVSSAVLGGISVVNRLRDIEVYSDMMFERIFYNLIENSVRHGERVSTISVSDSETENGLVLVVEDDGVGIPDNEKEIVFERGFGKNTGYGLYITREILDLTGISIRERGAFGKGARFEIIVPVGAFRRPDQAVT